MPNPFWSLIFLTICPSYFQSFQRLMPSSLQILVSSFLIFFTIVSVSKEIQARLLKNVNEHFRIFVGQNQQKTKMGWKAHKCWKYCLTINILRDHPFKTSANFHDFLPLAPYHRHSSKMLMKGIFVPYVLWPFDHRHLGTPLPP